MASRAGRTVVRLAETSSRLNCVDEKYEIAIIGYDTLRPLRHLV